jgi:anti-sigma regulatory factor (Ser/Thr protein kinase)
MTKSGPVTSTEESMIRLSPEGISVHMRIPAERGYIGNAVFTLQEICEHLDIGKFMFRIMLVLEEALLNAVEHAYVEKGGIVDLQFSVGNDEFTVVVEDFGCGIPVHSEQIPETHEGILCDRGRGLTIVKALPNKATVETTAGKGTKATMLFFMKECYA